jgi:predicted house-cleaning noncanonical NTP pyrophosphatase (MazG superfamily)/8-oxo-dGTP pyrophosphatase MutT (NUDIX family)
MSTRTFKLQKLVRDKIVQDHIDSGGKVKFKKLNQKEKREALANKIIEEAKELRDSKEILEELADVQEVLDQLAKDAGITKAQITAAQKKKRDTNGGFESGDYIEQETWAKDHEWAKYYSNEPKRFPERNMHRTSEVFYVGIKGLIENKDNEILLLKAIVKDPQVATKPYWDLPGGRVEESQAALDVLKREIEEETGIKKICNITLFHTLISNHISKYKNKDMRLLLVVYKVNIPENSRITLSHEHLSYEWVERKEAAKRLAHKYPEEFTSLL